MSQAEDLLNSLTDDGAMTYTANAATEPHIVIGADRVIVIPEELKRLAVQYDHNIETVTFDCPRYWDEHDMSKMKVYINYIRADMKPGSYPVDTGVTVDETDDTIMHFDWTITREVTEAKGNIIFLVCTKSVDSDGNEHEHWNSELCKDAYISEGLEVLGTIINQYPDIVTHLLTRMDTVEEKTTLQSMLNYLDTYFTTDAKINEVLKNYVTEWLGEDAEAQAYIADVINTYVSDVLKPTDKTLSIDGGVADAKAVGDALELVKSSIKTDKTLSIDGGVADAKAVGDALELVKNSIKTDKTLSISDTAADAAAVGEAIKNIIVIDSTKPSKAGLWFNTRI